MSSKKDGCVDSLGRLSNSPKKGCVELSQAELDFRAAELILKTSKEIVVKFIEAGRLSPAAFDSAFQIVHVSVRDAFYSTFHKPTQEA